MLLKQVTVSLSVFLILIISAYALHHHTKRELYEEMFTRSSGYKEIMQEFNGMKAVFKPREYVRIGTIASAISESAEDVKK